MKFFYGNDSPPIETNRLEALAILLKTNTRVNLTLPGTGNTPLHLTVRRQDKWAVAMLLHKGADVRAKNSSKTTPIQVTANQFRGELSPDHAQVSDLLLKANSSGKASGADDAAGALNRTALHHAVVSGTAQAVDMLLSHGASPFLEDKDRRNAIALTFRHVGRLGADPGRVEDHTEIMERLELAAGCGWPVKQGRCITDVALADKVDLTLLRSLLDYKLDVNARFRRGTALHRAVEHWNMEGVKAASW
jgi:ankyrin repeat protein